ncbi:hypothetical protein NHX12_014986 [Muraenolepis orangiensis]|uniref:Beta/gamma crystallin 'Greek key' domain-containing protein n=1 Tax=Muraenolepis orangiensis TaxID=630683 RepID=A0A9Q0DB30_9TELE|nr:hypothetical protein NHX12_014986 [Muraenolepis orangiensis]
MSTTASSDWRRVDKRPGQAFRIDDESGFYLMGVGRIQTLAGWQRATQSPVVITVTKASNPGTILMEITFYEDKNFLGRSYECASDCADMHSHVSRCNSARVESGCWVLYEKPNYAGYQYVLPRGEYPEYQRWMGYNDSVHSCRSFSSHPSGGAHLMKIYERPDFQGQATECSEDCDSVQERYRRRDIASCHVVGGYWTLYEHPEYRGRQYFMRPGEYRKSNDWGAACSTVGSFRRVTDF